MSAYLSSTIELVDGDTLTYDVFPDPRVVPGYDTALKHVLAVSMLPPTITPRWVLSEALVRLLALAIVDWTRADFPSEESLRELCEDDLIALFSDIGIVYGLNRLTNTPT